jgi:hypothetical protein
MTRASTGASPFSATQGFKAAEALVPKPTNAFTFVDTALLYGRLDAALRPMLVMAAAFAPGIANAVDLNKLPAPEVITKHLSPIVMSQIYQNDGYVTESVGPVSMYQAILGIAGASGAAAALYQRQFVPPARSASPATGSASPMTSNAPGASAPTPTPADKGDDSTDEP